MPYSYARTEILIGTEGVATLKSKTVLVAGLGGVGGYCAEALARAGIGHMIILDHDTVSPSNLNRQLPALHSTLGQKKTAVMARRLSDINPDLDLCVAEQFLRADAASAFIADKNIDFIADCIDSIACKAALVYAGQQQHLRVISAMGAGNRLDVTKVRIRTLNQTSGCPLARELRKALKILGADLRYPVVFSDEPRRQPLPHQPIEGAEPGRARAVNGTISYLPALFGFMMAGYIVKELLNSSD